MKSFTSMLGWLLLIAVLAVPSFLFYNWWSRSKQESQAEQAREPVAGNIFPADKTGLAASATQPLAAPARSADDARPDGPARPAAAPAAKSEAAAGKQPEQFPSAAAKPLAGTPSPEPKISTAAEQGAAQSDPGQAQVETSTVPKPISYYNPTSDRDPTFSPEDYRRIKDAQLRREEEERQRRLAEARRSKEPALETRINLQGIVGNAAIINGDMYNTGQTVGGVKILKIGSDYVIAEYKGKKFRKVLK